MLEENKIIRFKYQQTCSCFKCGTSTTNPKFCSRKCYLEFWRENKFGFQKGNQFHKLVVDLGRARIRHRTTKEELAKKRSEIFKGRPSEKKNKSYNEMYGEERAKEIIQARNLTFLNENIPDKISKTVSDLYLTGKYNFYCKGKFFSEKNNEEFIYRSSWELIIMNYLEQWRDVVKYSYEDLQISYLDENGKSHRTIPDFIVYFRNGAKWIAEVKPIYKLKRYIRERIKVKAIGRYARENGYKFVLFEDGLIHCIEGISYLRDNLTNEWYLINAQKNN
jgi:hypothetical protein